nr:hypothetical protein [Tanacetum cinerariifolium]
SDAAKDDVMEGFDDVIIEGGNGYEEDDDVGDLKKKTKIEAKKIKDQNLSVANEE